MIIDSIESVFGEFRAEHGLADRALDVAADRLRAPLQGVLREMYVRTGAHPFHRAENRIVRPGELCFRENHLVFYVEGQGVCEWGIHRESLVLDDPPVHTSAQDADRVRFVPEFSSTSTFIAFQAAWQAVGGALPYVGVLLPGAEDEGFPGRVAPDRRDVDAFGVGTWSTTNADVHIGDGEIAFLQADGYLGLAATSAHIFERRSRRLGLAIDDWDYATLRDG